MCAIIIRTDAAILTGFPFRKRKSQVLYRLLQQYTAVFCQVFISVGNTPVSISGGINNYNLPVSVAGHNPPQR